MNAPVMPAPPQRDQALLSRVRAKALPGLASVFAAALDRFDDALFDRSESGSGHMQFLDAMRELRRQRPVLMASFDAHLDRVWQQWQAGNVQAADALLAAPASTDGLSLVDEDELEARLAVRNFAAVVGRDCRGVLARLERRLAWAQGHTELDSDHNPIGPGHVGVCLQSVFALTDVGASVRVVLLKLCEREFLPGLARLYEELDALLAAGGALPEAEPVAIRRSVDAPTERAAPSVPHWMRRLADPGAGDAGLADETADPGAQASSLLAALHGLLSHSRQQHGQSPEPPGADQRSLSQQEMLNVLSLLQSTPEMLLPDCVDGEDISLAHRLKSEVLASAGQLGMDMSQARLGDSDEDAIDLVGMLFDVILDERDLPGRSREVIGRLVVPFVKVAMLDRRMFVQKTHPARRLLNALAEACEGNAGQTPAERTLLAKVEEITERLRSEFNENLAIFMTLEEEFRDYVLQHRRKVEIAERRAAETQRGQEKLEFARRRAAEELASRQSADLPAPINDFLGTAWRHHLTLQLLREPDESAVSVVEALQLADGLLAELGHARTGAVTPGTPWLQSWLDPLARVFASVGLYGEGLQRSLAVLQRTLQVIAEQRPELTPVLPELPQLSMPTAPAPEAVPAELEQATRRREFNGDDAQRFRELEIGAWLDFVDKDGKVQAGKLSWISPISSRMLFVNRRGVRFCVASAEELAVMVRLGRLRPHENDSTFDAAMLGVIDRLDASPADAGVRLH